MGCWARGGFDVEFRYVDRVQDAMEIIRDYPERSLHQVVLGGHGCNRGVFWSETMDLAYGDGGVADFYRELNKKLKLKSHLFLFACSTAAEPMSDEKLESQPWPQHVKEKVAEEQRKKFPTDPKMPSLEYTNFFHFTAAILSGVEVLASKPVLYHTALKQGVGADCMRGDTLTLTDEKRSQQPIWRCKDLRSVDELHIVKKCSSECGKECNTGMMTLEGAPEFNDCPLEGWLFSTPTTRKICTLPELKDQPTPYEEATAGKLGGAMGM
eukprot:TRINITY_DN70192_c0_g1_i1.p1 TRINITY_DN70192_c0_g1~~TRINITY_DN70192_c0_g1_i1.p1  ORF type:complete len:268 (-),score=37.43 TRINITY_DN70192_c0_g1_i1:208-1011(-)